MAGLTELARRHAELTDADVDRLQLLLADWQLLADLSFSDLVLWVPTWTGSGYVAVAQLRPTTGPTLFAEDLVGAFLPRGRRPILDEARSLGRVVARHDPDPLAPAEAVPVPGARTGSVVAIIARHVDPEVIRVRSRLEDNYVETADMLARMIAQGSFPQPGGVRDPDASPRVGDGFVRLDVAGFVSYASPNALSAYRRLGLAADLVGAPLASTTARLAAGRAPVDEDLSMVAAGRRAGEAEVEARGAVLTLRAIPLLDGGQRTGALVLLRDVTDVRRRERELVTKDATIREIHHRVKNNLQTVAALLRLQARRAEEPGSRLALEEAVNRVASIALVHETLSMTAEESVDFDAIADRLLGMVVEVAEAGGVTSGTKAQRVGSFGQFGAEIATPLALVLTELVQNAVEHGFPDQQGLVEVRVARLADELRVVVEDDGQGLPEGFDVEDSATLGLQIARTLLGDLRGSLSLGPRPDGGTRAEIRVPLG